MEILNDNKMVDIKGGGFNVKLMAIIGSGLVFLIGLIDGIINPQKCN